MPKTAVSLSPQGPGILPMRHRGFDQDNPNWDLDKRAILLGFEVTGRDDNASPDSIGHFKEDVDTRGDINCANYWQADDYSKRPVGCWAFGYASVVKTTASSPNTTGSSLYGNSDTTQTGQGTMKVLPIGQGGMPDQRFKPKSPIVLQPEGAPGGDAGAPGANGDPGNGGDAGGGPDDNGVTDLGGGWQYQDGVLVYNGPAPGSVDSLSGFNGGYWGGGFVGFNGVNNIAGGGSGFAGFTFPGVGGGSTSNLTGIPGTGFHSGFPGFSFGNGNRR